uniref:Galactokinase n=1 Tax=Parascaris univalens TaxID=6257 RepID=A0A915C7S7_PARUN
GVGKPQWYHYFLCGWKGSIPPCAGLSSSSSVVCASALATLAIHTHGTFDVISRAELAELCAHAEHYIGTESGGMDQAIEVLAMKG